MVAGQGCDPAAIAEVIVTRVDGGEWRASGYRVTATALLTAAHAVADARRIVLRFDAGQEGQWTVDAEPAWCDPESDVAILRFAPPEGAPETAPVSYGRFARDASAVVDVHTAGFPLWKRRAGRSGCCCSRRCFPTRRSRAMACSSKTGCGICWATAS